jgi:hypothetical protein
MSADADGGRAPGVPLPGREGPGAAVGQGLAGLREASPVLTGPQPGINRMYGVSKHSDVVILALDRPH